MVYQQVPQQACYKIQVVPDQECRCTRDQTIRHHALSCTAIVDRKKLGGGGTGIRIGT